MPLLLALSFVALAPHSQPATGPVLGPGPGVNDAVRMASTMQWNAAVTWNDAVTWNATVDWNSALAANQAANQPAPRPRSPQPVAPRRSQARVSASAASSSGSSSWDGVAACESSGNWSTNTGNGYYGGLQMDMAFWQSHGGTQYASRPDLATKDEQIAVANQAGSRSPWPVCGSH